MPRTEQSKGIRWRLWLNVALIGVVLTVVAYTGREIRRFVRNDPRFTLAGPDDRGAGLTMEGVVHVSRSRVLATFSPDFGRSVFQAPIDERRRRLLAIDWVEDASIARIWPNRMAVRIKERKPVAFVNLPGPGGRGSRVLLIDAEGVLLEPPPQSHFAFPVLSGITEEHTEPERRQRVQAMLRLLNDLGPLGKDISEVNAAAPESLAIVTQVEGTALELALGNHNFSQRMQNFLEHYPEIRRQSGNARAFDLRLDDRITAGTERQ
jgi:cell division protein FtsQ